MKNLRTGLLVALTALGCASTASAGTASGNLNVTALVNSACSVDSGTLDFGAVNPALGSAGVGVTLNTTCTLLTPYVLTAGNGRNYDGAGSTRRMLRVGAPATPTAGDYLNYNFLVSTRSLGLLSFDAVGFGVGTGLPLPTLVTGVIPAGQNVQSGSYSDTVVITVNF